MNGETLKQARARLEQLTPMVRDCGRLCGAACCESDEDGQGGVYLFPGEEALLGGMEWGRLEESPLAPRAGTPMLVCEDACDRSRRPLACMIFPLTPVVDAEGNVDVRFDCRARAMCPLVRHGMTGLRREFVAAARAAMELVASDPDGLCFLREWQALEEQYDFKL